MKAKADEPRSKRPANEYEANKNGTALRGNDGKRRSASNGNCLLL